MSYLRASREVGDEMLRCMRWLSCALLSGSPAHHSSSDGMTMVCACQRSDRPCSDGCRHYALSLIRSWQCEGGERALGWTLQGQPWLKDLREADEELSQGLPPILPTMQDRTPSSGCRVACRQ